MKIQVKMNVDIPMGLYCKKCWRKERDKRNQMFCSLFNRFIYIRRGDYLKCRECVNALYDEIEKNG